MNDTSKEIALNEISKRIDGIEEEVVRVRDKIHDFRTENGAIILNIGEIDNTLTNIYQNQKSLSANVIDLNKRLGELEKISLQIKIVTSHWKLIFGMIAISVLIGFAVENGLKDVVKILLPDKVVQAAKVINSDG
jgi:hypothetical protein